ncbi:MAG: CYTH and CHAD domain-containing protein [Nocardiaceae bacterium]|nr:CYTH and CHAD domain-containing protein [Nocardiaceae bacterium]
MKEHLERESKWEIDETFTLPAFGDIDEGVSVAQTTIELTSTYFDTADHDLLAHGLTLRQRVGDADNGWQLKVPAESGRTEIRTDPFEVVPGELTELTKGVRLGKQLDVVATIYTTRDRYRLLTPEGELWAEVADDHVRATVPAHPDEAMVWREVEVEAGPAADDLSGVADRLVSAGATESAAPSKLARTLGVPSPSESATTSPDALRGYLRKQIEIIFAGDLGLRRKLDQIHDTRVAVRRLRSTVRVFKKLLETSKIGDLDTELKWFAGEMGVVRDCQVQRKRFASAIAELDPTLVVGPIARQLDFQLLKHQTEARGDLADAMDSARYLELLERLDRWTTEPPIAAPVTPKALRKRARKAAGKADRRLAAALSGGDDSELHRARKAAKRARYAFELSARKKKAKHYKKIQRVLGDHQDSVVARGTLLRIAANAAPGEMNTFTLGVLHTNERHRAAEARAAARRL